MRFLAHESCESAVVRAGVNRRPTMPSARRRRHAIAGPRTFPSAALDGPAGCFLIYYRVC